MRHAHSWQFVLLLLAAFGGTASAFIVQTSVSSADQQTRVVRWPALPQDFVVDGGTLGGADGMPLILNALDTWDNVATARRLGGDLYVYTDGQGHTVDFTTSNFGIDYGIIGDGVNEIVFDEDGSILELLGLDPAGVAGIGITVEDPANQSIIDAMLILNGTFPSNASLDREATAVHELGHVWGMGHTFVGAINRANGVPGAYPLRAAFVPTMYPYTNPVDDAYGRSLETDDVAGISWLYPETVSAPPYQVPFGSDTGRLRGRATYRGQLPLTAVHVRAVNADNTDIQVAGLSGFAADGSGAFEIPGLPPGRYYLVAESIDGRDDITAANIEDDGIGCCILEGFADIATPQTTTVAAGGTVAGFQFDIPTLPLANDDAVEFGLPAGVPFTFASVPCRRLFLYSNGFVSLHRFENPDPAVTLPEPDLLDFLSRPVAKIAPLRTDLDPEGNADRRVDAAAGTGQVTFSFTNQRVVGTAGRATFSLTLFSSGDFRFNYGTVTAGTALAGYTAGVFATGGLEGSSDLKAFLGGSVPTAHDPVKYQLLQAVDLANASLYFPKPATDAFPVRNRLIYPWLAHNSYFDLGLAVVSNSNYSARLRVTALDGDGRPLPVNSGQNPVLVTLAPYAQFVTQIGQLFDFQGGTADGWVLVETDNPDPVGIQGFFLAQSYSGGVMDSLDGAVALADVDRTLIFPRYTGGAEDFTELTVVNPNPVTADLTLHVYFADGGEITQTASLAPNGAGIFSFADAGLAYVVADASEPVAGFAMNFNLNGSLAGQPGRYLWESRANLVSPHFVYQPGYFASRLDLVNPNNQAATVTATLHNASGQVVGHPVQVTINGWYNALLEIDPATFGFAAGSLTDGWIGISADRPVLGAMTFGDPGYALYQSTLPLLGWPTHGTLNAHLAQGNAGGINYLTGLAVLSLDGGNLFALDVYDPDGNFRAGIQDTLASDERAIGLLNEWMPSGPWPQVSGYLAGAADQGVYVYEIFTTDTGGFFAAVPAQKYLPIQTEADDANNGWTDAPEPLQTFPVEVRGQLSAMDSGYFLIDLGGGYIDEIEDLYRFQPARTGWYIIGLFPDNRYCDMDLYLFDSQWNIIASATTGVPGVEYIELELQPGNYAIGVSLYDLGWFDACGYNLTVEPDAIQ